MAVGTFVGSFTKATATGNQDITLPTGCPDLTGAAAGSWAIMFWTSGPNGTATGVWGANIVASLGFTAGAANSYAAGASFNDAVAASVAGRRMAAKCITFADPAGGAVLAEADFVSFPTSTTMRINWTSNSGALYPVMFTVFTGLTGAKVVQWATPTTAIPVSVTGAGFSPDLVLHAQALVAALPASGTQANLSFGAMNKHGQQWSNTIISANALNPSNTSRWQQTDACFTTVDQTEVIFAQAHFKSMDADGFTTNFSTSPAAYQVISLCLKGVSSKLGAFVTVAGTPVTYATRAGFQPRGALFTNFRDSPTAGPSAHAIWNMGATDFTNHRSASLFDKDAVTPTQAKSLWLNDASLVVAYDSALQYKATVTSDSGGVLTATVSTATAALEVLYLLIGDTGTNTFPATVGV